MGARANDDALLARWAAAGWDRQGRHPVDAAVQHLQGWGHRVHEGSFAVLRQLLGARLDLAPTPPQRKTRTVSFEAQAAAEQIDHAALEQVSSDHGLDLGLVGYLPTDRGTWLAADTAGTLYAGVDARRLHVLGDTLEQALLSLADPPDTWARAEPGPPEPRPLVHTPQPPAPVEDPAAAAAAVEAVRDTSATGPVLGVTDLGPGWRVFRAVRPDRPEPSPVPYLVQKATGAIALEWPLLPVRPSAQDTRAAIERELTATLAARPDVTRRDGGWARAGISDGPLVRLRAHARSANRAVVLLHLEVRGADGTTSIVESTNTPDGMAFFAALAGLPPGPMAALLTDAVMNALQ